MLGYVPKQCSCLSYKVTIYIDPNLRQVLIKYCIVKYNVLNTTKVFCTLAYVKDNKNVFDVLWRQLSMMICIFVFALLTRIPTQSSKANKTNIFNAI